MEKEIQSPLKSKITLKSQNFKGLLLELHSQALEGLEPVISPYKIKGRSFTVLHFNRLKLIKLVKMEQIDVLKEEIEFFASYSEEIRHSLEENLGIGDLKDWRKGQRDFITVYKLVQLDLPLGEYQNEVEKQRIVLLKFCLIL